LVCGSRSDGRNGIRRVTGTAVTCMRESTHTYVVTMCEARNIGVLVRTGAATESRRPTYYRTRTLNPPARTTAIKPTVTAHQTLNRLVSDPAFNIDALCAKVKAGHNAVLR